MSCRPVVKRTYSRLAAKKDEDGDALREKENFVNEIDVCRSIKKTKINDFFKKKGDPDSSFELSPLAKLKLESSPSSKAALSITMSPLITAKKHVQVQTFLDLGQKGLVSTQCPDCLMHYNKSFPEDKALHKRFHAQYLRGFRYDPAEAVAEELAPIAEKLDTWRRYRFFSGGDVLIKKLDQFLRFVSVQLGAEPLEAYEMKSKHSLTVAIEASSHEIASCVLFEPIQRAYLSKDGCSDANIELEDAEVPAEWGVSRIWTAEKHRNRGLASLLLDLKASSKRSSLAFSQPTPTGFAFAKAFQSAHFSGNQCLIYLSNR